MILWIDAQISPDLAPWIEENFGVTARPIRDFVTLVERLGAPPHILWVTCGNTSNARLKEIFGQTLSAALDLVRNGEPLVEISDAR